MEFEKLLFRVFLQVQEKSFSYLSSWNLSGQSPQRSQNFSTKYSFFYIFFSINLEAHARNSFLKRGIKKFVWMYIFEKKKKNVFNPHCPYTSGFADSFICKIRDFWIDNIFFWKSVLLQFTTWIVQNHLAWKHHRATQFTNVESNEFTVFAFGKTYEVLFIARSIQGVSSACIGVSGMSLVASQYPEEDKRSKVMGFVLGSIATGVLAGYPMGSVLYDLEGKMTPFLLVASFIVLLIGSN